MALRPYALRCDHRTTPLGIDESAPMLSWRLVSGRRGEDPAAYRIRVAERPEDLDEGGRPLWDTGRVEDPAAIGAVYEGPPLRARTRYHWRVTVWAAGPREPYGRAGSSGPYDAAGPGDPARSADSVRSASPARPVRPAFPAGSAEDTSWFETGMTVRSSDKPFSGPSDRPFGALSATPSEAPSAAGPWRASWIAHDPRPIEVMDAPTEGERALDHHGLAPCPLLRRAFPGSTATRARLYVSARGLYEVRLNGTRVGDAELAPGWTDYTRRIQYQTYDVTELLRDGENVLAATVADGWWSGFVGFEPRRAGAHYGSRPQFLAELHSTGTDGRTTTIVTDGSWRTHTGAIRHADLLMGECHDLRYAADGWDLPGFDDSGWTPAQAVDSDHRLLVASVDEPVRATATLRPRSLTRIRDGVHVVDFGQNLAGRVRLRLGRLAPGARVVIRHGEALDETGALYTANLRTAAATDILIGDGRAPVVFEPRFTYHGFRYAEISGVPHLDEDAVVAVALHSDTPWTGAFDCSDPDVRRLHTCVGWGQRSNFVSVPTDCPQRDERLGWLADAQVFLPTAALNADVAAFYTKWLRDVDDARTPDGGFTNVAPRLVGVADEGAPGWADAGVIIPWHLYRTYADPRFLSRALPGMRAWVELIHRHNPDLIWRRRVGPHFSDWLAPGTPTPRDVIATAYFAHSARLTARAADVLGQRDVARDFHKLASDIREVFVERFVTTADHGTTVRVEGDTQTGYLIALAFGLLPTAEAVDGAARRLAELIEQAGPALQTGFLGVALAAPVLDAHGRDDLAHALLRRTDVPSWLFPLRHGATTIWERWDGWTPEAGFRAPSMNSFNHYALGSIGEWLYRGVAGLDQKPDSTGYRELCIRPRPGGLTHASARYESARGTVAVRWRREGDRFDLDVQVPPGATAEVRVPTSDPESVRADGEAAGDADGDAAGEAAREADGDADGEVAGGRGPYEEHRQYDGHKPVDGHGRDHAPGGYGTSPHITRVAAASDHALYRVASGRYRFTAALTAPGAPRPPLTPHPRTSAPAAPSSVGSHEEDTP
ncbi:family 78 glycoside hydrolase catalytic domain [Streptomyces sp. GMY02]|uniref:alpha-L-rhamnosidase n=1 Tax=Streptomyces sp. GMY02 TaxID=1333528 RepID=UPI001C2BFCD9|nr:alpha-L-rhamnosidase [Streptomyces sp. GMY02]QXE34192.1 family 78 glycoside hydrolase catalytic domain [Streptomyces sp. GMY02]